MGKAEAFTKMEAEDLINFMKQNVIYKFGILKTLVMDNGPQYDNIKFRKMCGEFNIKPHFASKSY